MRAWSVLSHSGIAAYSEVLGCTQYCTGTAVGDTGAVYCISDTRYNTGLERGTRRYQVFKYCTLIHRSTGNSGIAGYSEVLGAPGVLHCCGIFTLV